MDYERHTFCDHAWYYCLELPSSRASQIDSFLENKYLLLEYATDIVRNLQHEGYLFQYRLDIGYHSHMASFWKKHALQHYLEKFHLMVQTL